VPDLIAQINRPLTLASGQRTQVPAVFIASGTVTGPLRTITVALNTKVNVARETIRIVEFRHAHPARRTHAYTWTAMIQVDPTDPPRTPISR